ncbi:MAG TPA: thiol reductant ABC exporter subunit CydC [Anaerolineaceae bacterium]|nr:thiol reductant ABC exporter subunit CydC [Anaerolineaceae bacterium]
MRIFLRLLGFLKPFSGWVALSILLGVATIASNIGLLGTSAFLISRAALHPSIAELEVAIVGVRFFGVARGLFRYLERLVSHSVNFQVLGELRVWFYRKLEPLAPARLQDIHSGDLLSRSVADIDTLQDFYVRVVSPPVTALVITTGMSLFLSQYHPGLAFVLVGGLLLSGIGVPFLAGWISRGPARAQVACRAELSQAIVGGLQGMPDLLAFDRVEQTIQDFAGLTSHLGQAQLRLGWSGAAISGINLLVVNLTLLGVLLVAIPLVSSGTINGVILAVLALVTLASFEAVAPLGQSAQQLQSSLSSAQRLFDVANQTPAVIEPAAPASPPLSMALSIRDLTYSYEPGLAPALKNISLELPPGKRIGILGSSGSGKSTLLRLLLRFWDCPDGSILLNGIDLRHYASSDVRRKIAVISQDTYLFTTTLRENLLLARPGASEGELVSALERAQLQDWFGSLPQGLDTWIGEHGVLMSGGERQRLAVARAVLQDARLYLFDEPASGLDPETEARLVEMLLDLTQGQSVLWVAHSPIGMDAMDEVLVLSGGRVVEQGKSFGLLKHSGYFTRFGGTFEDRPAS